jgi:hypothetical protein
LGDSGLSVKMELIEVIVEWTVGRGWWSLVLAG